LTGCVYVGDKEVEQTGLIHVYDEVDMNEGVEAEEYDTCTLESRGMEEMELEYGM
jgi:hypothetical protein